MAGRMSALCPRLTARRPRLAVLCRRLAVLRRYLAVLRRFNSPFPGHKTSGPRLHRPGAPGPGPGVRPPRPQSFRSRVPTLSPQRRDSPRAGLRRLPPLAPKPGSISASWSRRRRRDRYGRGRRRRRCFRPRLRPRTPTGHPGPEPRGDPSGRFCHRAPRRRSPAKAVSARQRSRHPSLTLRGHPPPASAAPPTPLRR